MRYRSNVFLPQLPKVGCPKILEIRNSWRERKERSGLRCELLLKNGVNHSEMFFFYGFFPLCSLHLNVFLLPLPKVQCQNFSDFSNLWGKLMKRSGLRFLILLLIKGVKLPRKKNDFFLTNFVLLAGCFGISATNRIGCEMLCILYAGFYIAANSKRI